MSHIVIIEDRPDNARLAEKLLTRAGHRITIAEDGETGLHVVLQQLPDLVLIDLGLPDIDGQTIAAIIRRDPGMKAAKIVAFTAWPEDRALQMARAYGCDGVISKPIDTRQFTAQVEKFLTPSTSSQTEQK